MIKDFFISFKDNFKEKVRNPFLGTYLIVWLIRNWELLFTLFNFDHDQKLNDKVNFIKNYYKHHNFLNNLWTNVYWAFGLLIITYLLINLSRFIVNLYEKRLTPWIYKITDSKSIVIRTEYDRIRTERDELQERLDSERESKSRLESRIKNLEAEIINVSNIENENPKSKKVNESEVKKSRTNEILLKKLKDGKFIQAFMDVSMKINYGEYIPDDYGPMDYFIKLGLINFKDNHFAEKSKRYTLSDDGEEILKLLRLEAE